MMPINLQRNLPAGREQQAVDGPCIRVSVQVPTADRALIRAVATVLRREPNGTGGVRARLRDAVQDRCAETAFDILIGPAPGAFEGVFERYEHAPSPAQNTSSGRFG
jgi:hypothetical protein